MLLPLLLRLQLLVTTGPAASRAARDRQTATRLRPMQWPASSATTLPSPVPTSASVAAPPPSWSAKTASSRAQPRFVELEGILSLGVPIFTLVIPSHPLPPHPSPPLLLFQRRLPPHHRFNNVSRYNEEFEELGELGTGEFGTVYKCRNRLDGIEYAIKRSKKPISGLAEEYVPSLRGRGGRGG